MPTFKSNSLRTVVLRDMSSFNGPFLGLLTECNIEKVYIEGDKALLACLVKHVRGVKELNCVSRFPVQSYNERA